MGEAPGELHEACESLGVSLCLGWGFDVVVGLVVFGGCGVFDVEGVCDGGYCAFGFLVGDLFFGGEGSVGEVLGDFL